ncbi:hypothetical protein LTR72_000233 [Exophiala xenobiotica]|nr:hypothetical protein LTR92_002944 [Exophiala xenobiotica]KAK5231053.1 hypothetical protein LTR72_000233 [Exophiala xenobiotica]KAK5499594.1 hypothetical protein LTR55_000417 [Exophiala xenobiotica]
MSKPKAFLKKSKSKKNAEQALETADDFLAAGVDFEEAAGKWRAGDAVKSMRFFSKAIDVYDRGLQKFPNSLDLAYNKSVEAASLACREPAGIQQLQAPILEVLQQALEAHRYALSLDQDNADSLFNTAQVLTAIAEESAKDSNRPDQEALQALEEALELQNRCLGVQELKLEESNQQQNEAASQMASEEPNPVESKAMDEGADEGVVTPANNAADQWFLAVEPVTKETLVDTILAELGTLTTLCSILASSTTSAPAKSLAWVEEFSSRLLQTKLPVLVQNAEAERLQEVALAKANFLSSLLEAGYRTGSIDASTYKRERDEAFRSPGLDLERDFAALMANANSLISFNAALADDNAADPSSQASQRWNALSAAIVNMTVASKISGPVPEDIAETHLIRGNCSLLQYQLGLPPSMYQPATSNAPQLLKNADTFYRNAGKLYQEEDMKAICQLRAFVSQALLSGSDLMSALASSNAQTSEEWLESQIQDMIDEGLIAPSS